MDDPAKTTPIPYPPTAPEQQLPVVTVNLDDPPATRWSDIVVPRKVRASLRVVVCRRRIVFVRRWRRRQSRLLGDGRREPRRRRVGTRTPRCPEVSSVYGALVVLLWWYCSGGTALLVLLWWYSGRRHPHTRRGNSCALAMQLPSQSSFPEKQKT
jgi:hypothetical protein